MDPTPLSKINQLEARYKQSINWPYFMQDDTKETSNSRSRSPWASAHSATLPEEVSTSGNSPCVPTFASVDSSTFPTPPTNDVATKRMSSSWEFCPGVVPLVPVTAPLPIMSTSLTTCKNFDRFDDEFNHLPPRPSSNALGPVPIAQGDRGFMSQQDLAEAMQGWTTFSTSPPRANRPLVSPAHSAKGRVETWIPGASRSNMNGTPQNVRDNFSSNPWNIPWNTSNNSSPSRQGSRLNESPFKENPESLSPYTPSPAGSNRVESRSSSQSTPSPGGTARAEFKLSPGCPSPIGARRVELGKSAVSSNSGRINWSGPGSLTNSPVSNSDSEVKPRIEVLRHSNSESCGVLNECGELRQEIHSVSDGFVFGSHGCMSSSNGDAQKVNVDAVEMAGMSADLKAGENSGTPSHGSARPSLTIGGLSLSGQPRRRQALNLACVPQKVPDRSEMDVKYQDVIKNSGFLTLDGRRVATDIRDLVHLGDLGKGTCGHVVKMMHRESGQVMAVKQMHRSGSFEDNKRILMDLDIVLKCDSCPFIVRSIGTFITPSEVWICMELMATCLDKLSKRVSKPIPEPILGKVAVATVNALHYLKEKHGVIHRDIKPSNILLDERGRIKLCDFGISGRLVDSKAKTRSAGCTAYMSPERIDPPDPMKPDYDIRADVWSLGLSLVELAIGEFPYKDCKTDFEVLTKVLQSEPPCLPSGCGFSIEFASFVQQCLTKNYQNRPKYQQLLDHGFIQWYTSASVDVATWYSVVKREIESKEALNSQSDG